MIEFNKIYCSDGVKGINKIEDNSIDMILTDPPFGINHKKSEWDKKTDFKENIIKLDEEFMRILKPGCYYVSWIPRKEMLKIGAYLDDIFLFVELLPFAGYKNIKTCFYDNIVPLIVKVKGKPKRFTPSPKTYYITNSGNTSKTSRDNPRNINHPSAKNYKTCMYFISFLTKPNDVVLDPFMGSGTTALSCIKLNRNFIGFETNKGYCDLAENRLKEIPKRKIESWEVF